jgi:hypothetical protein
VASAVVIAVALVLLDVLDRKRKKVLARKAEQGWGRRSPRATAPPCSEVAAQREGVRAAAGHQAHLT